MRFKQIFQNKYFLVLLFALLLLAFASIPYGVYREESEFYDYELAEVQAFLEVDTSLKSRDNSLVPYSQYETIYSDYYFEVEFKGLARDCYNQIDWRDKYKEQVVECERETQLNVYYMDSDDSFQDGADKFDRKCGFDETDWRFDCSSTDDWDYGDGGRETTRVNIELDEGSDYLKSVLIAVTDINTVLDSSYYYYAYVTAWTYMYGTNYHKFGVPFRHRIYDNTRSYWSSQDVVCESNQIFNEGFYPAKLDFVLPDSFYKQPSQIVNTELRKLVASWGCENVTVLDSEYDYESNVFQKFFDEEYEYLGNQSLSQKFEQGIFSLISDKVSNFFIELKTMFRDWSQMLYSKVKLNEDEFQVKVKERV